MAVPTGRIPTLSSTLFLVFVVSQAVIGSCCGWACGEADDFEADDFEGDGVAMLHLSMHLEHATLSQPTVVNVTATGGVDVERGLEKDSAEGVAAKVPATHDAAVAMAVAVGTSGAAAPAKAYGLHNEVIFFDPMRSQTFFMLVVVVLGLVLMWIQTRFSTRSQGVASIAAPHLSKGSCGLDGPVGSALQDSSAKAAPDTQSMKVQAPAPEPVAKQPEAAPDTQSMKVQAPAPEPVAKQPECAPPPQPAQPPAASPLPAGAGDAESTSHPGACDEAAEILSLLWEIVGIEGEEERGRITNKIKASASNWIPALDDNDGSDAPGRQQSGQSEIEQELAAPTPVSCAQADDPCDPEPEPICQESKQKATYSSRSFERIHARMRSGAPFKRPWKLEHNIGAVVDAASEG